MAKIQNRFSDNFGFHSDGKEGKKKKKKNSKVTITPSVPKDKHHHLHSAALYLHLKQQRSKSHVEAATQLSVFHRLSPFLFRFCSLWPFTSVSSLLNQPAGSVSSESHILPQWAPTWAARKWCGLTAPWSSPRCPPQLAAAWTSRWRMNVPPPSTDRGVLDHLWYLQRREIITKASKLSDRYDSYDQKLHDSS